MMRFVIILVVLTILFPLTGCGKPSAVKLADNAKAELFKTARALEPQLSGDVERNIEDIEKGRDSLSNMDMKFYSRNLQPETFKALSKWRDYRAQVEIEGKAK